MHFLSKEKTFENSVIDVFIYIKKQIEFISPVTHRVKIANELGGFITQIGKLVMNAPNLTNKMKKQTVTIYISTWKEKHNKWEFQIITLFQVSNPDVV